MGYMLSLTSCLRGIYTDIQLSLARKLCIDQTTVLLYEFQSWTLLVDLVKCSEALHVKYMYQWHILICNAEVKHIAMMTLMSLNETFTHITRFCRNFLQLLSSVDFRSLPPPSRIEIGMRSGGAIRQARCLAPPPWNIYWSRIRRWVIVLCQIFKFWSLLQSKSVNYVRKPLQLLPLTRPSSLDPTCWYSYILHALMFLFLFNVCIC